jgi:hypothetical protein
MQDTMAVQEREPPHFDSMAGLAEGHGCSQSSNPCADDDDFQRHVPRRLGGMRQVRSAVVNPSLRTICTCTCLSVGGANRK